MIDGIDRIHRPGPSGNRNRTAHLVTEQALIGLPTVKYFADKICLSPNYFGDLVKQQTGKTAQNYIQLKMISIAKERMLEPGSTVKQIADSLGFRYPQHFVRFFKRQTGCTPKEYRNIIEKGPMTHAKTCAPTPPLSVIRGAEV